MHMSMNDRFVCCDLCTVCMCWPVCVLFVSTLRPNDRDALNIFNNELSLFCIITHFCRISGFSFGLLKSSTRCQQESNLIVVNILELLKHWKPLHVCVFESAFDYLKRNCLIVFYFFVFWKIWTFKLMQI